MKILFTGGSSFTGYWFVKELLDQGDEVVVIFSKGLETYTGIRRQRVEELKCKCETVFECSLASSRFFQLIESSRWDLWCHHAAYVHNYRSFDFDPFIAVANNTLELPRILDLFKQKGCQKIVLTGTFYEFGEGGEEGGKQALYPYGLSKSLTTQVFRFYTGLHHFSLGRFVIPNPFGPFEEERLSCYLIKNWMQGQIPLIKTPAYIRDNIHVSLLAKAYAKFTLNLPSKEGYATFRPSGYVETQESFAKRFAREIEKRIKSPCPLEFTLHHPFLEPKVRVNSDKLDPLELNWNEEEAWDRLAHYYLKRGWE